MLEAGHVTLTQNMSIYRNINRNAITLNEIVKQSLCYKGCQLNNAKAKRRRNRKNTDLILTISTAMIAERGFWIGYLHRNLVPPNTNTIEVESAS